MLLYNDHTSSRQHNTVELVMSGMGREFTCAKCGLPVSPTAFYIRRTWITPVMPAMAFSYHHADDDCSPVPR
jgi:hypothetical protein